MSEGILIFAINSDIDYVAAATFAAKQAKQWLGLPATIITDETCLVPDGVFENVIRINDTTSTDRQFRTPNGTIVTTKWFNESRTRAYELSPYDKTLLIDADYFIYNDSLKCMFDTDTELACFDEINDIAGMTPNRNRISDISIPMFWATVVYFKKCEFSEAVFSFMNVIKNNWEYYSILYHFMNHNFRNDYALSIALQALSGYSTKNFCRLPGRLQTFFSQIGIKSVSKNGEIVYFTGDQINKVINTNIHCMNKLALPLFYA